jgi:hypothetical protein
VYIYIYITFKLHSCSIPFCNDSALERAVSNAPSRGLYTMPIGRLTDSPMKGPLRQHLSDYSIYSGGGRDIASGNVLSDL